MPDLIDPCADPETISAASRVNSPAAVANIEELTPVEKVRMAIATAVQAGEKPPGRTTLIDLTGLTEWQVRRAQAELDDLAGATPEPSGPAEDAAVNAGEPGDTEPPTDLQPARPQIKRRRIPETWPLFFIGLAAGVAVWSGWVGLGELTGFGVIQPFPGLWDELHINTSIVLPVSVEAYAAYALRCWLAGERFSRRAVRFAMWSAISSLVIGAGAQIAFHLMTAAGMTRAPWWITMLVACIPVVVLGLATALAKLVTSDLQAGESR